MRNKDRNIKFCLIIFLIIYVFGIPSFSFAEDLPLHLIKLPPGFKIAIFAKNIPGARSMVLGKKGTLFIGTRNHRGKVYAVVDENNDARADKIYVVADGLNMPNGVAFRGQSLYVAEISRVIRFDKIESNLDNPPAPVLVNDSFPKDEHHGWKFIKFGPDGLLYVPVGAPCNVCLEKDPRYATIMRMKPDGTGLQIYAEGIRNTVGFDWHPRTRGLWFTDNGRDWMGDNFPPDELNSADEKGLHFGFPFCHGKQITDPNYGKFRSCKEFIAPKKELGPHVAALGMRFYSGDMFPKEYKNQIFIAEHGSWNRVTPLGYRITTAQIKDNNEIDYKVFAEGWLSGRGVWGRPVDVLVMPDGALLVSDDKAGVIYRISYEKG